jgi:chromosome segregation ATPase
MAQQLASAASAAASSTAVALHAELVAAKESAAENARQVRQLSDELDKLKSARVAESDAQQVVLQDWKQKLEQQKAAWVQLRSERRQGEIALAELRSELDRKSTQLLVRC